MPQEEEVAEVFGSERLPPDSIKYLARSSILQDLVITKRAFANQVVHKKISGSMIVKVDISNQPNSAKKSMDRVKILPSADLKEKLDNDDAYATVEEPIVAPAIFYQCKSKLGIKGGLTHKN